MIAWIAARLGVSALVAKLIIGGLLAGIVFIAIERWGAHQWEKGAARERIKVTAELESAKKAEWAAKQKEITAAAAILQDQTARLDADRKAVDERAADLERIWQASQATLAQVVTQARTRKEVSNAQIDSIPAALLIDALRAKSNELAKPKP